MRKRRIAMYSPGIVGLGHMRRHLLIAQALASSPLELVILMIAEARQAGAFAMTPGLDCLILPALREDQDKQVRPRYLDISLADAVRLRAATIRSAFEAFEPDVLIVDKLPRGAARELDSTLEYLKRKGRTRCVLGLRDVLDEPGAVECDWSTARDAEAIRDYYDDIWVYGDPEIYDAVREYQFPADVAAKVTYTGYLDQRPRMKFADVGADPLPGLKLPPGKLALCLVGGGQDGAALAEAFVRAELPQGFNGVLITGPFMPTDAQKRVHEFAEGNPRLRVLDFLPEPALLISRADRVVAMGGYNTICELLSFEKQALIVPRVRPRSEQWIRAQRLRALGLIEVLHPDHLSPAGITAWLAAPDRKPPRAKDHMDFEGLTRLPVLLEEVLARPARGATQSVKGSV
jgi:predicted glycosyltransferase